ncbi:MAG: diversity-generating retroelement protein Avd [Nitrospiraceae bacterium]
MRDESPGTLPAAVTKAYDMLLWLIGHVGKFPRSHRFVLGDRIESRMLAVLEALVLAAYSREKREHLHRANTDVQVLRLLVRAGKDLGFTSLKQYEFISGELVELGRQIGGWTKAQAR